MTDNIKSLTAIKDKKNTETHDSIMEYLDAVKEMMLESGDQATMMISLIGTHDGLYHSIYVAPQQVNEAIGILERYKVMLIDGMEGDE